MKKFLFLLLPILLNAQVYLWDDTQPGYSLDYDGSTEYLSNTPSLRLTNKFALVENFSDGNYNIGNTWTVSSGTYVVDNLVANPLSTNQYSLKCTGAGVISIPCNQAYGRWIFDLYKGGDANLSIVGIINSVGSFASDNGYRFSFTDLEVVGLVKRASGISTSLLNSANSYVSNSTWYRVTIERNTNGATTVYLNNVLVSTTGGSGTNPVTDNTYTSSNYFVLDLDANDRISNIICEYGEGSLDLSGHEKIKFDFDRTAETNSMNWSALGTYSLAQSSVDKKSGTYSLAMTTAVGDATNCITLASDYFTPIVAGEKYTYEFQARGTGVLGTDLLSGWNFTSGWTVNNGTQCSITDNNSFEILTANPAGVLKNGAFTVGKTYKVVYADNYNDTELRNGQLGSNPLIGSGNGTFYFVASSTYIYIRRTAGVGTVDVTTLTIQEVTLPTLTLSIGGQSKSFTNISCVPGTFTKVVWNFQATSNEVSQPIKLWANQADVVYCDDMSLTQAWDLLVNVWVKKDGKPSSSYQRILNVSNTTSEYRVNTGSTLEDIAFFTMGDGVTQISAGKTATPYDNQYHLWSAKLDRTNTSGLIVYLDGSAGTASNPTLVGKILGNQVCVGASVVAYAQKFSGLVGELQITKFTDIANSSVSASSLLSAYRNGLPSGWVGGTNVLRMKLKGSTTSEMLKDYSGIGNNMTGNNIDLTDRARATYKSK